MPNNETVIYLTEKGTTDHLAIPWTPQKINFRSGGQKFIEVDIMDYGTIQIPNGVGIRAVRWEDGILPGEAHSNMPWQHGGWQPPENYQGMFSMWKYNKTVLTMIVTGTPICMDVHIADYDVTYQDGFGDYHYYVEFSDCVQPSFTVTDTEIDTSDGVERDTDPTPAIYTILADDTLWGIAQCYLGDGLRWGEIYELNKEVIEDAAIQHGFKNSENGWWIFPGTVIKIPSTSVEDTNAGMTIELTNAPVYVSSDADSIAGRVTGTYYIYDGKEILGRYRITDKSSDVGRTPIGQYVIGWLPKEYI